PTARGWLPAKPSSRTRPGRFVLATRRPSPISAWCRNSPMPAVSASTSQSIRGCCRPKPQQGPPRRLPTPRRISSPMPSKPAPITMDAVYAAPGYLFRRMQQIAVALFVEECRALDLTPVQYAALVSIHTHPGIDATRLSAVIAFDRSTLGSVIERLESKKLIDRKPSGEDKRVKLLYLTKAGTAILRDIMPSVEKAQARMLQPLKPAQRKVLLSLLTQLVDLNNEASRVPLRAEDALEHLGKSG